MFAWTFSRYICLVLLSAVLLFANGCGKKDEDAASQDGAANAPAPPSEGAAATPPEAANATPPPAIAAPAIVTPLSWTPDEAQIAVGIPALNGTLDKAFALAKRLVPDPAIVDKAEQDMRDQFAALLGLENAASIGSAAAEKGIDLDSPAGLFIDFSAAMQMLLDASNAAMANPNQQPPLDMSKLLENPSLLFAFSVTDAELAETSAKDLLAKAHGEMKLEIQESNIGEIGLHLYPSLGSGYFIHGDYLCVGDISLLEGAAAHTAAPVSLRYGTAELPPASDDEIVSLVFTNRLVPFYQKLAEDLPAEAPAELKMQFEMQAAMMERMFGSGESEDPIIGTLNLDDEKLDLASHAHAESHPGMLAAAGEPVALNFLKFQPENSIAVIAAGLSEASKAMIQEQLKPTLAGGGGAATGMDFGALAETVLGAIGNEIVISASPSAALFPTVLGMINLEDTAAAKVLLGGMTQPTGQTHREVNISMLPMLFPILTAVSDDTLIIATDQAVLTGTIDKLKDGGATEFAEKLVPSLDAATPYYSLFVLNPAAAAQAAGPAMGGMVGGPLPPELQGPLTVIRQVRGTSGIEGPWITSQFTFHLNP